MYLAFLGYAVVAAKLFQVFYTTLQDHPSDQANSLWPSYESGKLVHVLPSSSSAAAVDNEMGRTESRIIMYDGRPALCKQLPSLKSHDHAIIIYIPPVSFGHFPLPYVITEEMYSTEMLVDLIIACTHELFLASNRLGCLTFTFVSTWPELDNKSGQQTDIVVLLTLYDAVSIPYSPLKNSTMGAV